MALLAAVLSLAVAAAAIARSATITIKTSGTILGNVVSTHGAHGTLAVR